MKYSARKLIAALLTLCLIVSLAACAPSEQPPQQSAGEQTPEQSAEASPSEAHEFKPGTYQSTQAGHNGPMEVSVALSEDAITAIEVVKGYETPGVSTKATTTDLPQSIIDTQTLNVDTISGATISSMAMLRAVEDCVQQAGGDPEAMKPAKQPIVAGQVDKEADVIIVGGGGAGLAAAVQAAQNGASVIIVEKVGYVGGNTMVSGGIYNAADEELQQKVEMTDGLASLVEEAIAEKPVDDAHAALIEKVKSEYNEYKKSGKTYLFDSSDWHALQTWNGGDKVADLALVEQLTAKALDSLHWLRDMGYEYRDEVQLGAGSLYPRTHVSVKPIGTGFIDAYMGKVGDLGIEIVYNTAAKELIQEGGKVVGVKAEDREGNAYTFKANKNVILATGGFAGNLEMVQEYNTSGKWPDLSKARTTNLPAIKGDGIAMAKAVGAGFRDMEQIQLLFICDPITGSVDHATFQPSGAAGALFLNKEGKRFVREDGRRDEIALGILAQTDAMMYMLQNADSKVRPDHTDLAGVPLEDLIADGSVFRGDTLEEVCAAAGVDPVAARETVDAYNKLVDENATSDEFGRVLFTIKLENGPWYITPRAPAVHHTMGGVTINLNCQVLDEAGEPIPGLYAAGEVVGGIHGANRLGGNAIVDTVVYGRTAGDNASQ